MSTQPLLASLAVERTAGEPTPGRYSPALALWSVHTSDGERPLVEVAGDLLAAVTKTLVQAESDDQPLNLLAELSTKTDAQAEKDDEIKSGLLEVSTKTSAQIEGDDNAPHLQQAGYSPLWF